MRHICSKVKAAICRLVYVKGTCNIPLVKKAATGVGLNIWREIGHKQWRTQLLAQGRQDAA